MPLNKDKFYVEETFFWKGERAWVRWEGHRGTSLAVFS